MRVAICFFFFLRFLKFLSSREIIYATAARISFTTQCEMIKQILLQSYLLGKDHYGIEITATNGQHA